MTVLSAPAQFRKPNRTSTLVLIAVLIFIGSGLSTAIALKNNVQIEGERKNRGSENPLASGTTAGEVSSKLVRFADDGIRRTFFSQYRSSQFR